MTPDDLRALADALDHMIPMTWPEKMHDMTALIQAAAYLRAQADAQPVAWIGPSRPKIDGADHRVLRQDYDASHGYGWSRDTAKANGFLPLYTHPAPAAPQAEPKRDPFAPDELEQIIDDYVADYELSDGEVSRDLSDEDRFMLKDAIMGLLVDPAWDRAWGALIDEQARKQAEPKRDQSMLDLLAVIHCDGGHHTEAVGIEQSIKDALTAVCVLKGKLAEAESKREPLMELLEFADISDGCQYGTLSTSFVRDLVREALGIGGDHD